MDVFLSDFQDLFFCDSLFFLLFSESLIKYLPANLMKDCPLFCGIYLTKEKPLNLMRVDHETYKGGIA